jgi:hypothetical protein
MSKTNDWLLGMQEDAEHMTQNEFISEHGESNIQIWVEVQNKMEDDWAMKEARLEEFREMQGEEI